MKKGLLEVKKARHTGFCFGVKRAIGIVEDFLKEKRRACSIGPIIHNPDVVKELSDKGLKVIDDISKAKGANIVIRSHGISPSLREKVKKLSMSMVDATCPFVERSHKIVTLLKKEGYKIIIIGEKNHPEIQALSEVAGGCCVVVTKEKDLRGLDLKGKRIAVVAQTTLSKDKFFDLAGLIFKTGCFEYRIFDTICNDVMQRQAEAKRLAEEVDAVVVVGGKMSANTKQLAKICRNSGAKTYHIETENELGRINLKNINSVGVISGASTPDRIVDRVVLKLKK